MLGVGIPLCELYSKNLMFVDAALRIFQPTASAYLCPSAEIDSPPEPAR